MSNKCGAVNKSNGKNCNLKAVVGDYCKKHEEYIKTAKYGTNGITDTFGNQGENHKGMQIIGKPRDVGYALEDFVEIIKKCNDEGIVTELYDLKTGIEKCPEYNIAINAYFLKIKNGVGALLKDLNKDEKDLFEEQMQLEWDSKAFMYGKVVEKHARHNLCFDEVSQEPDYAAGKGRIVSFNDILLTKHIKEKLPKYFGPKANDLVAEGNLYYNINYNGIGYHGDSERKIVIAIRLGNSFPLRYQWYLDSNPIGNYMDINLDSGDMYIMSDKAVGTDWKTRSIPTLRHAAGCTDFIDL